MSISAFNSALLLAAPVSAASVAASAIPYRSAPTISTGSFAIALAITMLALVALVGGIAYARRRGWIIGSRTGMRGTDTEGIELKASRRLSMATTTHVVAYRGFEYLVVESARGSVATVAPLNAPRAGQSSVP